MNLRSHRNKKGITSFEVIMWVPRIIFVTIVIFSVVFLIRAYVKINIDVSQVESDIFIYRTLYGQGGLSKLDPVLDQIDLGVIRKSDINEGTFEKLEDIQYYGEKNSAVGAEFIFSEIGSLDSQKFYYNKELYDRFLPVASLEESKGPGGARKQKRQIYILFEDEESKLIPALMEVTVVVPNS
ncbi:hypothetical protein ACFLZX_01670 [Nanoarchaeota archaeon]